MRDQRRETRDERRRRVASRPGVLAPVSRLLTLDSRPARRAFTLVEMLVSTAIILIMLLLFAQIFGTAVGTMREQQAMAQNDQKARSLENVLRNDFAKATYRQPRSKGVYGLVPLSATGPIDAARQRGFVYISENDVDDATDDVLHLTIDVRQNHRDPTTGLLQGRAAALDVTPGVSPGAASADLNQPDYDDGVYGNDVGQSHSAEVVYFLRGGNLYRRALLLREPPLPTIDGSPAEFSAQPGVGPLGAIAWTTPPPDVVDRKFTRMSGGVPIPSDYLAALDTFGSTDGDFWNDFDYSAWNWWKDVDGDGVPGPIGASGNDEYWLMFNEANSLQNTPGASPFPMALPQYRFGHRPPLDGVPGSTLVGQPVEYLLTGALVPVPFGFIGRFTHEETSSPAFGWPGVVPGDGNPSVPFHPLLGGYPPPSDPDGIGDTNLNQIIDIYEGGPRAGEDIILAGVESFDIEVWDEGFAETDLNGDGFVTTAAGSYEDRNANGVVDGLAPPLPPQWVNLGHDGTHPAGATGLGHYRVLATVRNITHGRQNSAYGPRVLLTNGPDAQPGIAGVDDDRDGTADNTLQEQGWRGSDDVSENNCFDTWHASATTGTRMPPFNPLRIPVAVAGTATGTLWTAGDLFQYGERVIFPGVEDVNDDGMLDPGEDRNGNGILDPSDPSYYYIPVKLLEDVDGDHILDAGEDLNTNMTLEGLTGVSEPEWPREPGATVVERVFIDTDGDSVPDSYRDGVIWQCFDNRIGLQMIRITVRYRDVKSGLPRQMSLVHSFVE
jgi:prepilin-type N-terminal cleavage/methylation domain-containing protein